jgi:polysaccharide pyruvyl transferase CsaB
MPRTQTQFSAQFPAQFALLCGYYGMGNAGDEALLVSLLQSLPPEITPIVLSKNPTETRDRYGVEAVDRWNLRQVLRAMRRSSIFIWGGGSLMQDSSSAISPIYYGGLMKLAQILGLQTIAWAQGIGPLHRRFNRALTRHVLKRSALVTVRDRVSHDLVQSWNIPVTLAPDPVWNLIADPQVDLSHLLGPRIAVNLRSHATLTPERLETIQLALIELQKITQGTIVLLPFQTSLDWDLAQDLQSQIPGSEVIFIENPQILKGIFQQVDLTIAMRLHGVIMAASERCPCFAISYDPKVERVMEALSLSGILLNNDMDLDPDRLLHTWEILLSQRNPADPAALIVEADRHRDRLQAALQPEAPSQTTE